jgi:hypothetical protein
MRMFPSERDRRASDTRTVSWLFRAMFLVVTGYGLAVATHYAFGWW